MICKPVFVLRNIIDFLSKRCMVIRVLTPSYFFLAFPFFATPSLQLTSKNICLLCKPASELHVKS